MYFPATMKGFIRKFIPSGNGVERTEKICVGSGIVGYISQDQDRLRVRFTRCGLEKLFNIFSFVKRNMTCCSQLIDRAANLWRHEDCAHKENGTVNMEKNFYP